MRKPQAKVRRTKRQREESPAQQGVASAQKVLAALLDKHDPPTKAKLQRKG